MTIQEKEQLVFQVISSVAHTQSLEIIEVKMGTHNKDIFIQVLADKTGGIDLEACSRLNRSIVEAIDKEGFFSEDGYSLEVASPGLDRPLVSYKDFLRHIHKEIKLHLKERVSGKMEYSGILKSISEQSLTLFVTKEKKEISVPLDQILKGLLVL